MKVVCSVKMYDDEGNLRFEKNNFRIEPTTYKISEMVTEYRINFTVALADDSYYYKSLNIKRGDINA